MLIEPTTNVELAREWQVTSTAKTHVTTATSALLPFGSSFVFTPPEITFQPFQMKIDAINLIMQMGGGNVSDLPSANVVSATVQSILGDPPANGEKPNIGLQVIKDTTNIVQVELLV